MFQLDNEEFFAKCKAQRKPRQWREESSISHAKSSALSDDFSGDCKPFPKIVTWGIEIELCILFLIFAGLVTHNHFFPYDAYKEQESRIRPKTLQFRMEDDSGKTWSSPDHEWLKDWVTIIDNRIKREGLSRVRNFDHEHFLKKFELEDDSGEIWAFEDPEYLARWVLWVNEFLKKEREAISDPNKKPRA